MPQASLEQAVPLVRRALKVLADREVTPQLGLLKSTLLQLDSTFSERTYGAGSFRDFAQKLASAGHVVLRESGRNVLVELSENGHGPSDDVSARAASAVEAAPRDAVSSSSPTARAADGIREIRRLLQSSAKPPRWPMYVRQLKQYLRGVDPTFDERKFGFENLGDLMRACQRDGLLRIERDRQGGMRIFPGNLGGPQPEPMQQDVEEVRESNDAAATESVAGDESWATQSASSATEVVDGDVVQEIEVPAVIDAVEAAAPEGEKPARGRRRRNEGSAKRPRKSADGPAAPRRKAKPRVSRHRAQSAGIKEEH
jgi:hypothetical protein